MKNAAEITRAFATGTTILTATVRAARWLQRAYGLMQRSSGRQTWATPPIEDWETWLHRQWEKLALAETSAPMLLTSLQERSIWTRMQREEARLLVSPANMAALAESAYALLSAYEAQDGRRHSWGKADAESFRGWASDFDQECARRNWMPRAGLEAKITAGLRQLPLPEEILLVGFDRITPAQNTLIRALGECGVQIQFTQAGFSNSTPEFLRAPGLRGEITACAFWAREILEQNPEARVGVTVPDLAAARSEIERVFRRVLMPESDDIFSSQSMPFEFSLGQPLADTPVVRAALLLLRWLHASLREEQISWLLLSGFWGSNTDEYLDLARLDARMRSSGVLSLETELAEFARRAETEHFAVPAKLKAIQKTAITTRTAGESRLPGQWTDLAQLLLREAGWPGTAKRDTLHFQAIRRWERTLDDIALLDFDGRKMDYSAFLNALEAHARETIFSPESHGAPVQIMGALEASGQQFDATWFLSADDERWPLRGHPHPLLPNELQRHFKMPYADTDNDLALAKAVTARIAKSAPAVVFSYAERNQDGELRPSPLLQSAEWRPAPALCEPVAARPECLEKLDDCSGTIAWPVDQPSGGADVLKLQAACPFQAFAAKRLRAEPLNRQEWGLSPMQRGSLLHKILEQIWSPKGGALHSLADLQTAMRERRLEEILSSAIAAIFAQLDTPNDEWIRAYLASEQRRLLTRLSEWMSVEAQRAPFEVEDCEKKLENVNVGGLKLRLRADRIDKLPNSERLLIDYKTGKVSPRDWEGPRPNEPQLPLYAIFGNVEDVRGVLFALIRAEETSFTGSLADLNRQLFPATKATAALGKIDYSESMRDEWENALLALAADFLRGEAAVDPKDGPATCAYCPMPGLCRVAEIRSPLETNMEAEHNGDDE